MPESSSHVHVGLYGEELACAHLMRDGMRIVDRNWRHPIGEIDIVARLDRTLVFCEVKTRRSLRFGTPMNAITPGKAHRIKQLARRWGMPAWARQRRFDVVCVLLSGDYARIDHRQGVL
ncbi:MAG TPA: YraN family protein [Candidatus Stackebrandtia excrementipullorum]|nr:YraN family protein [Candidatus Stackebrandtia excrementipullorum]